MDVFTAAGSYRESRIGGKFDTTAAFHEALVCETG
jgi:hypothetical protein